MEWVDIGVNLLDAAFDRDRDQVLERAWSAGISQMILTATDIEDCTAVQTLCASDPQRLFCTAGVHPHSARHWSTSAASELKRLAQADCVRAIGECGLDYNRDFSPRPEQRKALEQQLELAVELGYPVFLHEREASDTLVAMLREFRDQLPAAVVHCFTADKSALYGYLDLDLHIGITGWICDERRGTHLQPLVRDIPAGRLMLETDAPWLLPRTLSPRPKDRRNEPAFLPEVAAMVARCRGESLEQLAAHTSATARDFFGIAT